MRSLTIDGTLINDEADCYIIAEIGHNHQGDLNKAKEMFRVAKECGANAVKLQKRDNKALFTTSLYNKPYDHENSFGKTYGEHREFLEFGQAEYAELKQLANELDITFFATAFDHSSADFLAALDMPAYKIASGDLKNTPLLKHVAQIGKPMILSTGGGSAEDIRRAYDAIMPYNSQLSFLQCTASYPTPPEEINLNVIKTLRDNYPELVIGLSDHYNGIAMSMAAYMLGARIIEKHFTLNHTWKGTDHALSLEPIGLQKMIRDLHRANIAMGSGVKAVLDCEMSALDKMGKKLVAAKPLTKGQTLEPADIAIKSPGDGLAPYEFDKLIGRSLLRALDTDENIMFEDLA